MRIYRQALLALLAVMIGAACGTARDVPDTEHRNAYKCDSCHGYPPAASFVSLVDGQEKRHPQGVAPEQCAVCHPGTVQSDGHSFVVAGQHRDGQVEFAPFDTLACTACHGAPPATGAHAYHITKFNLTCEACHHGFDASTKTVDSGLHMNGNVDVILPNGAVIQPTRAPDGYWPADECQRCHAARDH